MRLPDHAPSGGWSTPVGRLSADRSPPKLQRGARPRRSAKGSRLMNVLVDVGLVAYLSLTATTFSVFAGLRGRLAVAIDSLPLPVLLREKGVTLIGCPFCASFWISLAVAGRDVWRALSLAGLASIPISLVLLALGPDDVPDELD